MASPEMETALPNLPYVVVAQRSAVGVQAAPTRLYTRARPLEGLGPGAPITATSPARETDFPNCAVPGPPGKRCCCDQEPALRMKTQAAPGPPRVEVPTRAVSPASATDWPKSTSDEAVGRSFCSRLQLPAERTKTYPPPVEVLLPRALTRTVSPDTATAPPKNSRPAESSPTSVACKLHTVPVRTKT